MNLPISLNLMLAGLTALRILCFVIMVLFLLLAIRAQFDANIAMGWGWATGLAATFWLAVALCGIARKTLLERANRG